VLRIIQYSDKLLATIILDEEIKMDWIIVIGYWIFGAFFFYAFYSYTKEVHLQDVWKGIPGGWIFSYLPYWVIKVFFFTMGILLVFLSIRYIYNVILVI